MKFVKWAGVITYYAFLRYIPSSTFPLIGKYCEKLRYFICKLIFINCGKNVCVGRGAHFGKGFDIEIGDNSGIGVNAKIPDCITIGKNVMMGPDVTFYNTSHRFERTDIPMIAQGSKRFENPVVEDDVWIGKGCIILPQVKIAKGTIIGAGSIVTKSFPEYSIIAGNPAKLIRTRK